MSIQRTFAFLFLAGSVLTACRSEESSNTATPDSLRIRKASTETLVVAAATAPVAWLGCQLVGAPCHPMALIPPGASAHTWEPTPSDLKDLQKATVYLRTGLSFEDAWIPRFASSLPDLRILDLRSGLSLLDQEEHHHGSEEADPHVWSSPRALLELSDTLASRWKGASPALDARIRRRQPALRRKLLALDSLARLQLAPFSGKTFLINHPGLGYLARDYGLVQKPLESHGQEPTPVTLFEIRRIARAQGIRAVFVQSEGPRRSAEQVASDLGVPVVDIDLLAPGDYDSLFRIALDRLAASL
jgi:zinc transport system substrate-binding protein